MAEDCIKEVISFPPQTTIHCLEKAQVFALDWEIPINYCNEEYCISLNKTMGNNLSHSIKEPGRRIGQGNIQITILLGMITLVRWVYRGIIWDRLLFWDQGIVEGNITHDYPPTLILVTSSWVSFSDRLWVPTLSFERCLKNKKNKTTHY